MLCRCHANVFFFRIEFERRDKSHLKKMAYFISFFFFFTKIDLPPINRRGWYEGMRYYYYNACRIRIATPNSGSTNSNSPPPPSRLLRSTYYYNIITVSRYRYSRLIGIAKTGFRLFVLFTRCMYNNIVMRRIAI